MGLDQDANSSGLHLVLGLSLTASVKETAPSTKPDDHHLCVIKPTPTKPYHPQTNGQEEVSNKELKKILEKTVASCRKD